jgi:hypothetical protein
MGNDASKPATVRSQQLPLAADHVIFGAVEPTEAAALKLLTSESMLLTVEDPSGPAFYGWCVARSHTVALQPGRVSGPQTATVHHLSVLTVLPPFRGHGHARSMLSHLSATAIWPLRPTEASLEFARLSVSGGPRALAAWFVLYCDDERFPYAWAEGDGSAAAAIERALGHAGMAAAARSGNWDIGLLSQAFSSFLVTALGYEQLHAQASAMLAVDAVIGLAGEEGESGEEEGESGAGAAPAVAEELAGSPSRPRTVKREAEVEAPSPSKRARHAPEPEEGHEAS